MAENFEQKERVSAEEKPDIMNDEFHVEEIFKKLLELRKAQEKEESRLL